MARIRTIKPEFFTSDVVGKLSYPSRLLFIGLWTLADREGRLEDRPVRIKVMLLPYNNDNVDELLNEIQVSGLIKRYEVEQKRFIQIVNFIEHQRPHPKEPQSLIPSPDIARKSRVKKRPAVEKNEETTPDRVDKGKGMDKGNGEHDMEDGAAVAANNGVCVSAELSVFKHWQTVMAHPDAKLTNDRKTKIKARLDEGYTVEQLKFAIDGCRLSPFHMGDNDRSTKYDDLNVICKNGAKVEWFMGIAEHPPSPNGKDSRQDEYNELIRKYAKPGADSNPTN